MFRLPCFRPRSFAAALWLLCVLSASAFAQSDTLLQRAEALLKANNAKGAYEILEPAESERAGQPAFDFLLARAAIDSGNVERGVFALERVLAVEPNNLAARSEIARAYVLLGERDNARTELRAVRERATSDEARATIDRFLTGIDAGPRRFNAYVEGGFGMDSNINTATGDPNLAIPGLGTVTLTGPGSTRMGDTFLGLNAGFNYSAPITGEWEWLASGSGAMRLNNGDDTHTRFDNNNMNGSLGLRWTRDKNSISVGLQKGSFYVDSTRFRDNTGVTAQWQHNFSDTSQGTVFAQYSDLTYPTQNIRNAERTILGVAYGMALPWRFSPVLFGSVYGGSENEYNPGVQHLGHRPIGVRLGGQFTLAAYTTLEASLGYEDRHYGGVEPIFNVTRNDTQTDIRVALTYKFANTWSVVPSLQWTSNDSNITLYKFTRTIAQVLVRKEF